MATVRREPLLVFYDGACGVCTGSIAWALRRDRYQRLLAVAAGSPLARDVVGPEHAPHLLDELHVWSESSGVRKGSDAVAALLIQLPGLGWAGRVLAFPLVRPFARIAYRWIARRRRFAAGAHEARNGRRVPDIRRPGRESPGP